MTGSVQAISKRGKCHCIRTHTFTFVLYASHHFRFIIQSVQYTLRANKHTAGCNYDIVTQITRATEHETNTKQIYLQSVRQDAPDKYTKSESKTSAN